MRFHRINRLVSSAEWDRLGGASVTGVTTYTLVVYHGSLIYESATPATVTYHAARIDYAISTELRYGYIPFNAMRVQAPTGFPTGIIDGDFMGENQDADITPADA